MAPAEEIRALRDRALAELTAAHDYHVDTAMAWRIVYNAVQAGLAVAVRNTTTGTVTTEA
jgi:hypothetical protein